MSVSRGEASGSWPARAGISTRVEIRHTWNAQRQSGAGARRSIKGPPDTNTQIARPGTSRGRVGMWTRNRKERTGRAAAGRAGSFNPEEQRSARFRSYGPPLREERFKISRVDFSRVSLSGANRVSGGARPVPAGRTVAGGRPVTTTGPGGRITISRATVTGQYQLRAWRRLITLGLSI